MAITVIYDTAKEWLGLWGAWVLVASIDSLEVARRLAEEYERRVEKVHWGRGYLVDPDRVEDTYNLVTRIFEREAGRHGLAPGQVVADITGGMKPMTAGMALACLAHDRDMQYMVARRRPDGRPDEDVPTEPVKIDRSFIPVQRVT